MPNTPNQKNSKTPNCWQDKILDTKGGRGGVSGDPGGNHSMQMRKRVWVCCSLCLCICVSGNSLDAKCMGDPFAPSVASVAGEGVPMGSLAPIEGCVVPHPRSLGGGAVPRPSPLRGVPSAPREVHRREDHTAAAAREGQRALPPDAPARSCRKGRKSSGNRDGGKWAGFRGRRLGGKGVTGLPLFESKKRGTVGGKGAWVSE